jgi:hypothetical protein
MATEKRLVSYPDRTVISTTGELVCRLGSRVATDWGRYLLGSLRRSLLGSLLGSLLDICERILLIEPSRRSERSDWTLERAERVDTGLSTVPTL